MSRPPALGTRDLYFTTECSVNAIIAAETAKSQTCNARRGHCARCWLLSWRAPVSTSVHCAGPALQTASRCRDQAPCMRPGHRRRGQTLRRSLASGTAGAWEGACCPGPPPPSFCELRRLACKAVSLPSPSHDTMPLNSGNQVAATTDPARPLPQQEEQVDGGRRRLAGRALRSGSIAKLAPLRVSSRRANRTRARCTAAIAPS